ncbi:hypothetical protein AAG570_012655 [Ranatra chinensis]|uniref:DUF155 domain-containing protein n=1 Tax=Ranatra chinensis TaxID=642074 RepID=A0ABD0YET1_9HEMI
MYVYVLQFWGVFAYATAEEYDLRRLKEALISQDLYIPCELASNDELKTGIGSALHAVAKYRVTSENRHLYYFKEGSVVMWNFSELERRSVLKFLKPYEDQSYDNAIVQDELEVMSYTYTHCSKRSDIHDSNMYISCQDKNIEEISLDRYTFSNAMALSVKLGMLEALLERYIRGVEYITEDLKYGHKIRIDQKEVLQKSGELLALRHSINLSSDLLDTPDFYWERENLEKLYQRACAYFSISRRTKVMNEKLNHCVELIELVSTYLSDRHHVRLEWMIIILIMVEVGIEFVDIIFFH